ncbi:hypothetical protein BBO99_00004261 [Phytophthora kernoviae]|uniref:Apple domain-containing protein n=2 Tax=Phytophthora kernoviae TaxID=325452 RepID=A0A3R7JT10_9STRA|nr:hypothetical protein G195_006389 [Phytophthora kernoviae 00238/432]KAG2523199.1 hypothetical protein JM16_005433 [Phytophthora kernoviae]KAG2524727.1 hypothetical protein JM18_005273 [Phytophthora kernoviae]RLN10781.1 hypothetical protein BBI17_004405 [Phytophthora kernoviae]RLN80769.1 hypothetical protein BBO99_00004261 [Phytophthora kernoviae]
MGGRIVGAVAHSPWNSGYYQCLDKPEFCPNQETDIDYYGNDLEVIYGVQPDVCCDRCASTSGCAAYTFVNENPDGKTACFLKTSTAGRVEKKGAVSAAYKDFVAPNNTCIADVWDGCGNSKDGTTCCPDEAYCQPWNSGYYQCIDLPDKCPVQETDIDYYGNDLQTIYGLYPTDCCERCAATSGCAAYTFINENDDGNTACYLKWSTTGRRENKGAVSAVYTTPTCTAKVGDPCGDANNGPMCCPTGSYCQPWNPDYYQCVDVPEWCPSVHEDIDFKGDDLSVQYGLLPDGCCNACNGDANCIAFTFVNKNDDGKSACYLKSGSGTWTPKAGVVSAFKAIAVEAN